jgi:hypothetical protein
VTLLGEKMGLVVKPRSNFRRILAVVLCFIVPFSIWFGWNEAEVSKTDMVQTKVKMFLRDGLEGMVANGPRTLVSNSYYAPDVNNQHETSYVVYTRLVYDLNIDRSSPMVKVTSVLLYSDFATEIDATAEVEFEYLPGITKKITVTESIPVPHYKHATGMETVTEGSFHNEGVSSPRH